MLMNALHLKACRSQLPGASERTYGESDKHEAHDDGYADKPVRDIAGPGTQRGIQPADGQNSEDGTNDFVKQLSEDPPEPPKSAGFLPARHRTRNRGHTSILAQNPRMRGWPTRPMGQVPAMDRLRTTEKAHLVSKYVKAYNRA